MKKILIFLIFLILIISSISVSAITICGNAFCEEGENPEVCPADCEIGPLDFFICAFDGDYCVGDSMRDQSVTVVLFLSGAIVFIWLKKKGFF